MMWIFPHAVPAIAVNHTGQASYRGGEVSGNGTRQTEAGQAGPAGAESRVGFLPTLLSHLHFGIVFCTSLSSLRYA